ncbi:MAG: alanine--tRNA ligase [Candidatus Dormibacteraeota bacterium]|uniref:Alanine--tRNA ligase n=1 Tax=Candidatus Amunia macphersoniae TaxID=3127014 RepID=A0A934KSA8_9BACT|nr:alanine--tRNA ligase [Candidatus Dormibacteraeota bacterium]
MDCRLRSYEIRERFLTYFEDHGHHRLPSASLITHDDPSLLFTVAGMVPLKRYITGELTPPSPRLASCQKCFRGQGLRWDDIAEVGDATHQTFFEMLGNWSIGDYFKEDAIRLAWTLLTEGYGLDAARLWPSIYPEDAESERIWREVGVPGDHIARLTDNWWQAGPTGPCGYDSEIYWDWGGRCSCGRANCRPDDECAGDRWVEIWNLVFMEFDQDETGRRTPLPKPTVDTGLGLDRLVAVVQGVRSNYETDLFRDIVANFAARSGAVPGSQRVAGLHVLADHVRAATFLIADGVVPGNEARGYVLRRLIRRALVHGRRVGLRGGLVPGVAAVMAIMGDVYPEIAENRELVESTLGTEEEAFTRTLDAGTDRLAVLLDTGSATIPGDEAFRLHDTYGLPIEVTAEMAAERGVAVDRAGFDAAMAAQRARSRAAHLQVGFEGGPQLPDTRFVGYDTLEADAAVVRIGGSEETEAVEAGLADVVILDTSPFYAEAGGQVGDIGELRFEGGRASVLGTTHAGGARLHSVRVEEGTLATGIAVRAVVDADRRSRVARHHSATHFLNQALREVLGAGIVQRGSYVGPEHSTFDFSFNRALTRDELRDIEARVNHNIRANLRRSVDQMPLSEAKASGAIALIDEKYTESVRVVDFGGWSRELCGGTHVNRTGDVGAAIIVGESSIGQGVRRIEMVAGEAAERRWQETGEALLSAARALRARPAEVPERVAGLQEQVRRGAKELEEARRRGGGLALPAVPSKVEDLGGVAYAVLLVESDADAQAIVDVIDRLFAEQLGGDGVAVVMGRDTFAIKVGPAAQARHIRAGDLAKAAAQLMGAKGGGHAGFGRGGIKDLVQRQSALSGIRDTVRRQAGGDEP